MTEKKTKKDIFQNRERKETKRNRNNQQQQAVAEVPFSLLQVSQL